MKIRKSDYLFSYITTYKYLYGTFYKLEDLLDDELYSMHLEAFVSLGYSPITYSKVYIKNNHGSEDAIFDFYQKYEYNRLHYTSKLVRGILK